MLKMLRARRSVSGMESSSPFSVLLWLASLLITIFSTQARASDSRSENELPVLSRNLHVRGSLQNSLNRFRTDKVGHVAFLGGSITEMDGYRPRLAAWLQDRFPETVFHFTNAGIASTCSHTGAFRLQRDVLSKGPVDLLLVEFAVNDDQDARHSAEDCVRGMEGIVRHVRQQSPKSDIVMIDFVNPEMLETAKSGKTPLSVEQHERVAAHYGVSSVNLPAELGDQIQAGSMTWETFGGTHPGPVGNQLAADLVASILLAGWQKAEVGAEPTDHPLPATPLLSSSFDRGEFVSDTAVIAEDGWTRGVPEWNPIAGSKRDRFLKESLFHSTQPGSVLSFRFSGHAVGAYVLAGPDAGQLDVQIDDGEWIRVELFHSFSSGLHYPRTVMFASGLERGDHTVRVRLANSHHENSKGTAARILSFVVSR